VFSRSIMALHFYEGLLMALDSVRSMGIDISVRVFDTENRKERVDSILRKGGLKGCSLIIGPFYSGEFQQVADHAKLLGIPIVSPTIHGRQIIENNPMVLKMMPTEERMMTALGRRLSHLKGTNNLVLHSGKADQQLLLWRFHEGLGVDSLRIRPSFPAIDISAGLRDSIFHRLSPIEPNHLLILEADEAKVARIVRSIAKWAEDEVEITIYGLSDWPRFRNVEPDLWDQLKLHVPAPFCINYSDEATERFIQAFRTLYGIDPNTFAFRGFDLGIHFFRALPGIRLNGPEHMLRVTDRGLQSDFRWVSITGGGMENLHPPMTVSEQDIIDGFRALQQRITAALEEEDGTGRFREDAWERPGGGGGFSRIMDMGAVI